MLRNYLKIAWRNLAKNRVYSAINIGGLAAGMAVAMLIGLWVHDELSFDRQFTKYDRLAELWQFVKFDAKKTAYDVVPVPLAQELRSHYPDFEAVSISASREVILARGDKKFTKNGNYVEPDFARMFSVNMRMGTGNGLSDVNTILLSESTAATLFGSANPLNQIVRLDNRLVATVYGLIFGDENFHSGPQDASSMAVGAGV